MNSSTKKALLIVAIALVVIVLVWYSGLYNYFTLTSVQSNRAYLEAIVTQNYWKAVAIFIGIYIAVIALAIPGVPPLTMVGGFLFGLFPGGMYAVTAATIGTTISFLLIRYVLSNLIRGKYAQKLERFNEKIASRGAASYLLTLQLAGLIPYFIINTLAALANVATTTFVWTTFVGSLPIIFIYAFAGRQLYLVESVRDIFSPSIIGLLLLLIFMSLLLPVLLKRSRRLSDLE
jgi:uncharacterized membrane protein YdjX (TVP38/TMEM64 family)